MAHQVKDIVESAENYQISISGIHEALVQEGFRPDVDDDGDIKFKWEGRWYYIRFQDDDLTFLRVCAINIAPTLEDTNVAMKCCNEVNADVKVAKAFVIERQGKPVVWVNAECRYAKTAEFMGQLIDLLGGIRAGVNHFREAMDANKGPSKIKEAPAASLLN